MKDIFLPILIAIVGVSGLLYGAYQTADVKGYTDNHSCFGVSLIFFVLFPFCSASGAGAKMYDKSDV